MNFEERSAVQECLPTLIQSLDVCSIADELFAKHCITNDQWEKVTSSNGATSAEKVRCLYKYIQQSANPDTFNHLLDALEPYHVHLKKKLELQLERIQRQVNSTGAHGALFRHHSEPHISPQEDEEMSSVATNPRSAWGKTTLARLPSDPGVYTRPCVPNAGEEGSFYEDDALMKHKEQANSVSSVRDKRYRKRESQGDECSDVDNEYLDCGRTNREDAAGGTRVTVNPLSYEKTDPGADPRKRRYSVPANANVNPHFRKPHYQNHDRESDPDGLRNRIAGDNISVYDHNLAGQADETKRKDETDSGVGRSNSDASVSKVSLGLEDSINRGKEGTKKMEVKFANDRGSRDKPVSGSVYLFYQREGSSSFRLGLEGNVQNGRRSRVYRVRNIHEKSVFAKAGTLSIGDIITAINGVATSKIESEVDAKMHINESVNVLILRVERLGYFTQVNKEVVLQRTLAGDFGCHYISGTVRPRYPNDSQYYISKVQPGSLAGKQLRVGDEIRQINGRSLAQLTSEDVKKLLNDGDPSKRLEIIRTEFSAPPVE